MEAMKTHKTNPNFAIGDYKIPTWITPLVLVLFISFIVPNTSFLGHLCGLLFGYGCKLSLTEDRYQTDHPRGAWIPQISRTTGVDS